MPKIVDHHRYRQELLNQCLTLFAEQGYGSITMRQIAQALGVSTGTLYHYFPSKESLFMQLVQELCEQDIAAFFAQAPEMDGLGDRLRLVMAFFLENYFHYQQQLLLWVDFYQHDQRKGEVHTEVLQNFWQRLHGQLADYLQLSTEQVDFMLVFMDGLLLQCIYGRDEPARDWMEEKINRLIDALESG